MIVQCHAEDKNKILSYIGADYPACLYLYLNLNKYGIDSDTIDVFMQTEQERITAVLLRYYSCLHVYSSDLSFDAEELSAFVEQHRFSMIYCTAAAADRIFEQLPTLMKDRSAVTYGWVAQIKQVDHSAKGTAVPARESDFDQIVRLIYDDEDIGRSYHYDELARQLAERNHDGHARNIVIKQGDLVIAHACTNAEYKDIAVVAELLVRKEYRRRGYASEIWRDLCEKLLMEGKQVFSFYYSPESRKLHKQIGFEEVCNWAKIVFAEE